MDVHSSSSKSGRDHVSIRHEGQNARPSNHYGAWQHHRFDRPGTDRAIVGGRWIVSGKWRQDVNGALDGKRGNVDGESKEGEKGGESKKDRKKSCCVI